MIAPVTAVGAPRVVGIRPVMPGPDQDPDDGGMGIEPITEPTIQLVDTGRVEAALQAQQSGIGGHGPGQQQPSLLVQAAQQVARTQATQAAPQLQQPQSRGNAAQATQFDRTPAATTTSAQVASFSSPFARAMGAYAGR